MDPPPPPMKDWGGGGGSVIEEPLMKDWGGVTVEPQMKDWGGGGGSVTLVLLKTGGRREVSYSGPPYGAEGGSYSGIPDEGPPG